MQLHALVGLGASSLFFWETTNMKSKTLRLTLASGLLAGAAVPAMANIVITPTFDSTITSNGNSAALMADINNAISVYQNLLTDNITVKIKFVDQNSGLGASSASTIHVTYADLRAHMVTDATSTDDATALAFLPIQANDPVTNANTGVDITTAQSRAMGYVNNPTLDGTIFLNSGTCHLDHGVNHASYDYETVVFHEIDEILGIGGWGSNIGFAPGIACLDLFRYDQNGARTFTTVAGQAFFSLNGTTHIDQFNQAPNGGDYADWIQHGTPEVQDWAGTQGPGSNLGSSEIRALDVSGYNLNTVPEPTSLAALGLGILALCRVRRKK